MKLTAFGLSFSVSLEPVIFLCQSSTLLFTGAQQSTNLLLDHACLVELGKGQEECARRSNDTEVEVQKIVNMFGLKNDFIGWVPTVFLSLVAGALSDKHGRKPLLLFPLIGMALEKLTFLVGTLFFYQIPLEFFYLSSANAFMGGLAVYFLGVYGYGSSSTTQEKRATRLGRYDGVEQVAALIGSALSPILFRAGGYSGSFIVGLVGNILAILYLVFFVEEPIQRIRNENTVDKELPIHLWLLSLINRFMVSPVIEMLRCVFKKRERGLRPILLLVFLSYGVYLFILPERHILYLYMLRSFEGFTGEDFAYFNVVIKLAGLFGLFVLVPIFSGRLHFHETGLLSVVTVLTTMSYLFSTFAVNFSPDFYAARLVDFLRMCTYCLNRSLVTRCIHDDEIGKCFSAIAFFAALVPFMASPSIRLLYNTTLTTFPAAVFLLCFSVMLPVTFINLYLFTQRGRIYTDQAGPQRNQTST